MFLIGSFFIAFNPCLISSSEKISLFAIFKGNIPLKFRQKSYGSYLSLLFIQVNNKQFIKSIIFVVNNSLIFSSNTNLVFSLSDEKSILKKPEVFFRVSIRVFLNSGQIIESYVLGLILRK